MSTPPLAAAAGPVADSLKSRVIHHGPL